MNAAQVFLRVTGCIALGILSACGGDPTSTTSTAAAHVSPATQPITGVSDTTSASSGTASSSGSAATSTATAASKSGALITTSNAKIVDSAMNTWSLSGGVIYKQAAASATPATAGYSANVKALFYFNGTIYQENSSCLWWSWNGSTWVSATNPDPSATPSCNASAATSTAATTTTTTTTPVTPSGFGVKVSGNQLVSTADDSVVHIEGMNISGLENQYGNSEWAPFTASVATWQGLKAKGINAVRIPLNEISWLGIQCDALYSGAPAMAADPNKTYQSIVKTAVANANAAGLYVILDLHWAMPNNPSTGRPWCPVGQGPWADKDHSVDFWTQVATTFKGNAAVIFELFNEPFGSNVWGNIPQDAVTLRDGGSHYPYNYQNSYSGGSGSQAITWQVAGFNELITAIRNTGASNVILAAPEWWASELEYWLQYRPSDPIDQMGASWHVYTWGNGKSVSSNQATPMSVLNAGFPVVITETNNNDLGVIAGDAWCDQKGISYLYWAWTAWNKNPLTDLGGLKFASTL